VRGGHEDIGETGRSNRERGREKKENCGMSERDEGRINMIRRKHFFRIYNQLE
jgi:hypothetical protein